MAGYQDFVRDIEGQNGHLLDALPSAIRPVSELRQDGLLDLAVECEGDAQRAYQPGYDAVCRKLIRNALIEQLLSNELTRQADCAQLAEAAESQLSEAYIIGRLIFKSKHRFKNEASYFRDVSPVALREIEGASSSELGAMQSFNDEELADRLQRVDDFISYESGIGFENELLEEQARKIAKTAYCVGVYTVWLVNEHERYYWQLHCWQLYESAKARLNSTPQAVRNLAAINSRLSR